MGIGHFTPTGLNAYHPEIIVAAESKKKKKPHKGVPVWSPVWGMGMHGVLQPTVGGIKQSWEGRLY